MLIPLHCCFKLFFILSRMYNPGACPVKSSQTTNPAEYKYSDPWVRDFYYKG